MVGKRFVSMALAMVLLVAMPAASTAQEDPAGPEGVDWALTSYLVDGALASVPVDVEATLLLEDGGASGSGGCNNFGGDYELDGDSLTVQLTAMTEMACFGGAGDVEEAYLSLLPDVVEWGIVEGELRLSDSFETILTFEAPGGGLTAVDLAVLLARFEAIEADVRALDQRIDNIRIGRLRERIRTLEAENASLKRQMAELRGSLGPSASASFNASERVLLEGVPARIKSTCRPLRSGLPSGTAAAVQCSPNTSNVTEMAYYLLDKSSAFKLFERKMRTEGVPAHSAEFGSEAVAGCGEGAPSYHYAPGGYVAGIGCYVKDGRANLRVVEQATACKQLKVGSKTLRQPVMYAALSGPDADIERVHDWAMRNKPNLRMSGLTVDIERPNAKDSPDCWAG